MSWRFLCPRLDFPATRRAAGGEPRRRPGADDENTALRPGLTAAAEPVVKTNARGADRFASHRRSN